MKRFVDGVEGEFFFQKRVPKTAPDWLETATVKFPSGRSATELVAGDAAHLVWAVNLGVIDFNPWPARRADLDHPDELRVDLDPTPEVGFEEVRQVAMVVREVLADHGDLAATRRPPARAGSTSTSASSREWAFTEVRRAALALAREVERRVPKLATSKWWKEERHGVFVDYNQNARDRTIASAYSVRPNAKARVSTPLEWDEVPDVDPAELRLDTVPKRLAERGDPSATIDDVHFSLEPLLELAARDEAGGLGDAPWPPHFAKQEGEPQAGAAEPGEEVGLTYCSSWSSVQSAGFLSSRQRRIFDPWRMRPALTWSKVISITSSGRRPTHSRSRSADQRLGSADPCSPEA